MAYYKISAQTLTDIADAVRSKIGTEEEIPCAELAEAIASIDIGEVVLESAGVAFSSQKVDPDVNYKVGRNWLADLVSVVQKMAGKKSDMTLDDVIYWLNRVLFIPQGNAESINDYAVSQVSIATGIIPVVQIGIALSENEYASSQESSGAGTLVVPPDTYMLYNNVRLPGIPESILTTNPYAFIHKSSTKYNLVFSTAKYYFANADSSKPDRLDASANVFNYWLTFEDYEAGKPWTLRNNTLYYWKISDEQQLVWSNYNVPNGSADATAIYFKGSEPVPVEKV